jgi:tetratricopeptide (TPR) repeat protein
LSENIKSEIIYRLGLSYFESGAFSQACSYFERILNSSHMSENRKKQLSYYMGECCFNLEEYNKALEYYISILKLTSLSFDYRSMLYSKIAGTSQLAKKQLTENSDLN